MPALGYDLNTVEFAVEDGVPYAIDFMNPAPDAGLESVGQANFEWIVREVADLAIAKAELAPHVHGVRWAAFLGAEAEKQAAKEGEGSTRSRGNRLPGAQKVVAVRDRPKALIPVLQACGSSSRTMTQSCPQE